MVDGFGLLAVARSILERGIARELVAVDEKEGKEPVASFRNGIRTDRRIGSLALIDRRP